MKKIIYIYLQKAIRKFENNLYLRKIKKHANIKEDMENEKNKVQIICIQH